MELGNQKYILIFKNKKDPLERISTYYYEEARDRKKGGNKTSVPIKIIATKVPGSSNIPKFACEVSFEEVWLRISCEELKFTHAYEDT